MNTFGPLYCETAHPFIVAEPVNTLSNLVIIAFGIASLFLIWRTRRSFPLDLTLLSALLLSTGVGSLLWHAFRTSYFLTADFLPGLLFVVFFTYLWVRRMYGMWGGIGAIIALVALLFGSSYVSQFLPIGNFFFFPIFLAIVILASVLVYFTKHLYGRSAALSSIIFICTALSGAFFRSIDLYTCSYIAFGTHFLWHIFLSLSAYLGIRFLLKIDEMKGNAV